MEHVLPRTVCLLFSSKPGEFYIVPPAALAEMQRCTRVEMLLRYYADQLTVEVYDLCPTLYDHLAAMDIVHCYLSERAVRLN